MTGPQQPNEPPSSVAGQSFGPAPGSAWEKINAIFKEADILEEMIQLRMERPGETRDSALEWAKEQVKRHGPNENVRPILLQHDETGRMLAWESHKPIPHGYSEIIPVLNIWEIGSR